MTWRIRILTAVAAMFLATPLLAQTSAPTWVILVRHAEKAATPANDPPLTAEGVARAKALAARLNYTQLDAVITTQFARTKETAEPTAQAHHVTPTVVAATDPNHAQAIADEVRKHGGKVVLVVGHSNTVPDIIAALGAPKPRAICDPEYDNLYIVSIPATGTPTIVQTRYGSPTPAGAACASMR
jgi:broad specificity phosphatase PhoE